MKGFLFDLDGVIVDTAKYHYIAWKRVGQQLGFELTHEHNEQLKGVSRVDSLERIIEWAGADCNAEEKQRLLVEKNEDYLRQIENMDTDEILEGVEEVLLYANKNNISVALGSASKNGTRILEKLGLTHYFQAIIDGNHVTRSKPDPEVFLKGAAALGLDPKDCIVFEDAAAGIEAAQKAGMKTIGMGGSPELAAADYCFDSMKKISPAFIETL